MPAITVAMITLNEEKAVAKVIDEVRAAIGDVDAEILIVDSSSDSTPQIAEAKGARVVRQFPPRGYGRAMVRVLEEARGDVVVTLDCDDTYPADQILPIAAMVSGGNVDLVNASRLERRPAAMPLANYFANWSFAMTAWLLLGAKTTDLHSGMRAYRRAMLETLTFDGSGPALPVELLLKPALAGYRIAEIFIPYRDRIGATTLNRWSSTVWTFRRIFRLLPLRFAHAGQTPIGDLGHRTE